MREPDKTYWSIPEVQLKEKNGYTSNYSDITIEVVDNTTTLKTIKDEWNGLERLADSGVPSYDWHLEWWRRYHDQQNYHLFVLLFKLNGQTVGVAPFYIKSHVVHHFRLYTRLMVLGTVVEENGADGGNNDVSENLTDILIAPGFESEVAHALTAYLESKVYSWDEALIRNIKEDSCLFRYVLPVLAEHNFQIDGYAKVVTGDSGEVKLSYGSTSNQASLIDRKVKENLTTTFREPEYMTEGLLEPGSLRDLFSASVTNGRVASLDRFDAVTNSDNPDSDVESTDDAGLPERPWLSWNIAFHPPAILQHDHRFLSLGLFKIHSRFNRILNRKRKEIKRINELGGDISRRAKYMGYVGAIFNFHKRVDKKAIRFDRSLLRFDGALMVGSGFGMHGKAVEYTIPDFIPVDEVQEKTTGILENGLSHDTGFATEYIKETGEMIKLWDQLNILERKFGSPLLTAEWIGSCVQAFCPPDKLNMVVIKSGNKPVAVAPVSIHGNLFRHKEIVGSSVLEEPGGVLYEDSRSLTRLVHELLELKMPLVLKGFRQFSPEIQAIERELQSRKMISLVKEEKISCVAVNGSWQEFEKQISSSRRSSFRRLERLAEKRGEVRFEAVKPTEANVDSYLDEVYRIEGANWKGRTGTSMQSYPVLGEFFRLYSRQEAKLGKLNLFFLKVGDESVAVQLTAVHDNRLWIYKVGHDEAWSFCSPGILLMHKVVRYCFDNGLTGCEYLGSDEPWLHIWANEFHSLVSYEIYPRTIKGILELWSAQSRTYSHKIAGILRKKWLN